jgi:manganese/zinc/iron transport system permease protein
MAPELEIQLIAAVVAASCALPGVFLVLRRMALMSDAISHAILVGIVIAFLVTRNLNSPLLILGAALTGLLTVWLVELLNGTRLVKEDAAIGLVFPALFSIGVILIARHAGNVHLDVDAVLLGELVFAPFNRFTLAGHDLGPQALWVMTSILLLNAAAIGLFYKELKLSTFDASLAGALGFAPAVLHYGFMSLVSITAVGAFDAVGSILVVALMIAPPATAYLLTDRLPRMIALSVGAGVMSALSGYWLARLLDASISGSMATMAGVIFLLGLLLAPERGVLAVRRRRARQRWVFGQTMLAIHLLNHEGTEAAVEESREEHLHTHLGWDPAFAAGVVRRAEVRGILRRAGKRLELTPDGRSEARERVGAAQGG